MAIQYEVETGSGSETANSYVAVADADQYLENTGRNLGAWAALGSSGKQRNLILAQQYMTARWNGKWRGRETNERQALDFPRIHIQRKNGYFFNQTDIPQEVKDAQVEYALVETLNPGSLFPTIQYDDTNRTVKKIREKVDVLEEEREFVDSPNVKSWRKFPIADGLIRHLVVTGGTLMRM
jgi:hypothetical protein